MRYLLSIFILTQTLFCYSQTINEAKRLKILTTSSSVTTQSVFTDKTFKAKDLLSVKDEFYPIEPNWSYYPYSTNSTLSLGRGFSPNHLDEVKQIPFLYDIIDSIEGQGSALTHFKMDIAYSKKSLMDFLDFDVKLGVKAPGFKADAFLKIIETTTFEESSLILVIKASTEFGKKSIRNLKLTKDAKKVLKKNTDDFIRIYGTKIPIMERRGASVYIVCKISNISETTKKEIQSGLTAEAGGLLFSAKLETKLNKVIKTATDNGNFNYQLVTTGGTGLNSLSSIIASSDLPNNPNSFFQLLKTGVSEYFKQFNFQNSVPIGFFCASYKDIDPSLKNIKTNELSLKQLRLLQIISSLYRENEKLLDKYIAITTGNSPVSGLLTNEQLLLIDKTVTPKLVTYLEKLSSLFTNYLNNEPKDDDEIPYFEYNELPFLSQFTPKIEMQLTNTSITRLSVKDDFKYIITSPYLSNVKIEYRFLDEGYSSNLNTLTEIFDPSATPIDSTVTFNKDQVIITNTFFSSSKFLEDIASTAGLNTNPRIEIIITAKNSLGDVSRKSIIVAYANNFSSNSTIVYKFSKDKYNKSADCKVEVICAHNFLGQMMWNIKIDGEKYRKWFPNGTSANDAKKNAEDDCKNGLLDADNWIPEWVKECDK